MEVRSNGERAVFKDNDVSIPTALSLNGRIFVSPKDLHHLDALVNNNILTIPYNIYYLLCLPTKGWGIPIISRIPLPYSV